MPKVISITCENVEIPQKVVFETAKGRTEVANALVLSIKADNGRVGRGEGTAVQYVTGETRATVTEDVERIAERLAGWDVNRWRAFCARVRELLPDRRTACAALEMAIVDLFCQTHELPMATFFGGAVKSVVTDLTIPIVAPEVAHELAKEAAQTYSSLKIKVGGPDREADFERVRQIHLGAPKARLRIDANQGFDPEGAVQFVYKLNGIGIVPEVVEQPVPKDDIEGLAEVTRRIAEPVFADEAALDGPTVLRLLRADAVDGVNIKLMKAGITGALDIIALCRAAGKQLMIGCMLESPVGIGTAVHLACGTGAFSFLDLDADVLGKPTGIQQNYVRDGETLTPLM